MSDDLKALHEIGVSDDLADRIIARAAALDVELASRVPLARLREIAREVGVSESALAAALAEFESEFSSAPPPTTRQWWQGTAAPSGWRARVTANAVAILGGATVIAALGRIYGALNLDPGLRTLGGLLTLLLIAEAAKRLGATTARLVTLALVVAQGTEVVFKLSMGWQIRGAESHFGIIAASIVGIALGALLTRRASPPQAASGQQPTQSDLQKPEVSRSIQRRSWWLRLQPPTERAAF